MKKVLCLLISLLCLVVLGCGGGEKPAVEKTLKVGVSANFPPFEYFQKDSKAYTGFDIDLMEAVAKEMGYDKVEFVNTDFANLLQGLNDKKYDAVISAMVASDERSAEADFSDAYVKGGYAVLAPANTAAQGSERELLSGKKIAVEKGSFTEELAAQYTDKIILCSSVEEALQKIAAKEADFAIASKYTGSFFAANGYGGTVKVMQEIQLGHHQDMSVAVRKGDALLPKINAALKEYRKSMAYDQLKKEYFGAVK